MTTRTLQLASLHAKARHRPRGYVEDVLDHAAWVDHERGEYGLSASELARLRIKWAPAPPRKPWRLPPPGTLLAMAIRTLSMGLIVPCTKCKSRAARIDRVGWRGLIGPWRRDGRG